MKSNLVQNCSLEPVLGRQFNLERFTIPCWFLIWIPTAKDLLVHLEASEGVVCGFIRGACCGQRCGLLGGRRDVCNAGTRRP